LRGLHLTILVMKEQQGLLREQDEELGKLGEGVQRVKALAGVMREELSEQTVMLEEFEDDVDKADSNMHSLQKRLRGLVDDAKSSDRALWSVIGCLVIVLLVLTFMVLS
jgi:t-SNARE complex subunit (syntaxin)